MSDFCVSCRLHFMHPDQNSLVGSTTRNRRPGAQKPKKVLKIEFSTDGNSTKNRKKVLKIVKNNFWYERK